MDLILSFAGTLSAVVAAVLALFESIERSAYISAKESTYNWIAGIRTYNVENTWTTGVVKIYENQFGSNYFSSRFIKRSALVTLVCTALSGIYLFYILDVTIVGELVGSVDSTGSIYYRYVVASIFIAALVSFIPDYISLIESKLILNELTKMKKLSHVYYMLLLDTLLTTCVLLTFGFFSTVVWIAFVGRVGFIEEFFVACGDTRMGYIMAGMVMGSISTYFTSVWVWAYILGGSTLKYLYRYFFPIYKLVDRICDISSHPFRSIGIILSVITTAFSTPLFCVYAVFIS